MGQRLHNELVSTLLVFCIGLSVGCDHETPVSGAPLELEETDVSNPGLLRSIMVGLGADMNEISRGLWLEDLAIVAAGARAIAEHPHVGDAERTRIQRVLEASFSEFVQGDHRVHDTAVGLAAAAAADDMSTVLDELAELQAGCVDCHQDFRARLR